MRFSRSSARRWRWISVAALVVAFGAVVVTLAVTPDALLNREGQLASVVSTLVSVVSLFISAATAQLAAKSPADPATEADRILDRAADDLARLVGQQWRREAQARLLLRPQPLRVRWASTGRPVAAPADEVLGSGAVGGRVLRLKLAGDVTQVADTLRGLPAGQLVVLGDPGAGKSVLALVLTLSLLTERAPGAPVPVLLSASSWYPREPFEDWLIRRLSQDYPVLTDRAAYGPDVPKRLVEGGRLMPIVDGLDEIFTPAHAAALESLNIFAGTDRPLVLTCRSAEYETAVTASGAPLARAAVVELEPVSGTEATSYLQSGQVGGQRRWAAVADAIQRDPGGPLAQALSTPLMVFLARTAYTRQGADPAELTQATRFPDRARIEEHLLGSYLSAVYTRAGAGVAYPPAKAISWLTFLAVNLQARGVRDWAWWEMPEAVQGWRFVAAGYVAGAFALACGVPVAAASGALLGFGCAAVAAVIGAILVALTVERGNPRLLALPAFGWRRSLVRAARYGFALGLPSALAGGLLIVLLGATSGLMTIGLALGLPAGAASGLAVGKVRGLPPQGRDPDTIDPGSVLRADRRGNLITLVVITVAGLLAAVAAHRYAMHARAGLDTVLLGSGMTGLLVGSLAGLTLAMVANPRSSWLSYSAARVYLAVRGRLPWRLMRFLDDAHRRGVLRQAGAIYQFRHAILQRHLGGGT